MADKEEVEVKFYVQDLGVLESRLKRMGATLLQPRIFEMNLRFDTPAGDLARRKQVLRLRQDTQARLTFKGAAQDRLDVAARQEIEFVVSDFGAARRFLEALGYQVVLIYEKFRAVFGFGDGIEVTLDEMPFSNFVEIEGPDAESIQKIASRLGLDWETRVIDSYMGLFEKLKGREKLEMRDLTFANFRNLNVGPEQLGVRQADQA
ncbi:MAG TPA: class IV adenylate cyclase [Anaerolineaceae bacterium]|nr:class IV adenylate cyclase [Anaerolineaceae bacterium]